ncbi:MAG: peptidase T [Ignavibacteria bacterium]|jgi:tripeptide aminopeptidase|nr:peptidase T [Ignavibacteria bacterium]
MKNDSVLDKLLRYVVIDTQSDDASETTPSTMKQFDLSKLLVEELQELGIKDASVDEHSYVYATIPSNLGSKDVPTIAFLAHLDTSPDASGKDVKPQIIKDYKGGDIVLPADNSVVIRQSENPELKNCIGHTIVTSDGTTLLGSDDKSGVASIMQMTQMLLSDSSINHGDIRICFTPDEEIGCGTKCIDLEKIGAKFAYTVDGDMPGELNKETFSADGATITITGRDIHPGSAKDIMINAGRVMGDILAKLPKDMAPETTDDRQPFIHPTSCSGSVISAQIKFILRDFDSNGLVKLKQILENVIAEVQQMYPKAKIELEVKTQYRNMLDYLGNATQGLDYLWEAATRAGVNPYWKPIRGGTDGSRLSEMGLPTPNIFTGGQNFHSRSEWVSITALEKTVDTLIHLVKIWAEK